MRPIHSSAGANDACGIYILMSTDSTQVSGGSFLFADRATLRWRELESQRVTYHGPIPYGLISRDLWGAAHDFANQQVKPEKPVAYGPAWCRRQSRHLAWTLQSHDLMVGNGGQVAGATIDAVAGASGIAGLVHWVGQNRKKVGEREGQAHEQELAYLGQDSGAENNEYDRLGGSNHGDHSGVGGAGAGTSSGHPGGRPMTAVGFLVDAADTRHVSKEMR